MTTPDTIRIRPAIGRRVRDPHNQVVPEEGIDIELLPAAKGTPIEDRLPGFWFRRLQDDDIEIERPKPATKPKET